MEEHSLVLRVRYAEVDRQDVVYHAHFFHWFDMGRTEYLRTAGVCYAEMEDRGLLLMVTRAEIRYRSPARLDDQIRVVTRPSWRTRSRICFQYQVIREADARLLASGETELCCVVRGGKPCALPSEIEAALTHLPLRPLLPGPGGERADTAGPTA